MVAFSHLSMIAFVILGLSMVRLMINFSALLAKNYNDDGDDDVKFYWPHTAFSFITFFTIILFWWTSYPLRDLTYYPNDGWNLFTFLLYLSVPFLFFMVSEVVAPQDHEGKAYDLQEYYYKNHKVILGLAWTLQVCLIGNLFVFFHGELLSLKVLGRFIMLAVMAPMVISDNKRVHEIGMGVFFVGFIYTIIKYHIFIEG
ncbi:uncharacterized protein METZ01_LOCUS470648 [marine metagenome]|uniref:Uncharacterized protein n=1 Tax=marine metagenome TaxID=408172 RepID=A0A383BD45_9ZZZZ